jgi:hypothetical protein
MTHISVPMGADVGFVVLHSNGPVGGGDAHGSNKRLLRGSQEQEKQQEVMDDDKEAVMKKQYITKKQETVPWKCVATFTCHLEGSTAQCSATMRNWALRGLAGVVGC